MSYQDKLGPLHLSFYDPSLDSPLLIIIFIVANRFFLMFQDVLVQNKNKDKSS